MHIILLAYHTPRNLGVRCSVGSILGFSIPLIDNVFPTLKICFITYLEPWDKTSFQIQMNAPLIPMGPSRHLYGGILPCRNKPNPSV